MIEQYPLKKGEWRNQRSAKSQIVLHWTASGPDPRSVIDWWNADGGGQRRRVATAYVIGRDGSVLQCFPDSHWANHLGGDVPDWVEKASIGIEMCAWGPLRRARTATEEKFLTYVQGPVPAGDVCDLGRTFRGHRYYQAISQAQLQSLEALLKGIASEHGINLSAGLPQRLKAKESLPQVVHTGTLKDSGPKIVEMQEWLQANGFHGPPGKPLAPDGQRGEWTNAARLSAVNDFEWDAAAVGGAPGIWSHTSYRKDKMDVHPQPELLELLRGLA